MKVDLAIANIEVSGTLKYIVFLTQGFASLGHSVRILYSGLGSSSQLVTPLLQSVSIARYAGTGSHFLSRVIFGGPILNLFTDFRPDQSVNLIGNLFAANRFAELTRDTDVIIYANIFAYPPLRLLQSRSCKEVLLFHESIASTNLPTPLRLTFQAYCRRVANNVTRTVAITDRTASILESEGIRALPIPNGFLDNTTIHNKERLVLADSRWGLGRDPFRILRIAQGVPDAQFVIVGRFQDPSAIKEFQDQLVASRMERRVKILGPVSESELQHLYGRAMIVLRWGNERGFTLSLVYAVSSSCIPVLSDSIGGSDYLARAVSPELVFATDSESIGIINRLLTDQKFYEEMRNRVAAWGRSRTWATVAQEILDSVS